MTRTDLQRLSRLRIRDAKILLKNGAHESAYYLAGYAVECALKACIAKQRQRHEFPDKKLADDSHTHDLKKLAGLAKLDDALQQGISSNNVFAEHWRVVRAWSELARYQNATPEMAEKLYAAITDRQNGVLTWLKKFW